MLKHINQIEKIIGRIDFETFRDDHVYEGAISRDFEIIGEAARFLPQHLTSRFPHVPWQSIRDTRHIIAHDYYGVSHSVLWATAHKELAGLKIALLEMQTLLTPEEKGDA